MDLKDLKNAEARAGVEVVPVFGLNFQIILCALLLVIFASHGSAQSSSDSTTEIAKYAMKLPEKTLLRIQPRVIKMPASQTPGFSVERRNWVSCQREKQYRGRIGRIRLEGGDRDDGVLGRRASDREQPGGERKERLGQWLDIELRRHG